jgi:hypothetical protein
LTHPMPKLQGLASKRKQKQAYDKSADRHSRS